jgi:hypothetical protein
MNSVVLNLEDHSFANNKNEELVPTYASCFSLLPRVSALTGRPAPHLDLKQLNAIKYDVISSQFLTIEAWVHAQGSQYRICGGQSGIGTCFLPDLQFLLST